MAAVLIIVLVTLHGAMSQDKTPVFDPDGVYTVDVYETQPVDSAILVVNATYSHDDIEYGISSSPMKKYFRMERYSGRLVVKVPLDYETRQIMSVDVTAKAKTSNTAYKRVVVNVRNVEDEALEFSQEKYVFLSTRDLEPATMSNNPSRFGACELYVNLYNATRYNPDTREPFRVRIPEDTPVGSFVTVLTSGNPVSGLVKLIIEVKNVNEFAPIIHSHLARQTVAYKGNTYVTKITATDADGDSIVTYQFSTPNPCFTINGKGEIFTTRKILDTHFDTHFLDVIVLDDGNNPLMAATRVVVKLPRRVDTTLIVLIVALCLLLAALVAFIVYDCVRPGHLYVPRTTKIPSPKLAKFDDFTLPTIVSRSNDTHDPSSMSA